MFSVRLSRGFLIAGGGLAAILLLQGCSNSTLARFAPPGLVKYEDIASKKPPNPAIEQTVRDYREDTKSRFPVLSETPTAEPAPQIPTGAVRDATKADLIEGRDELAKALEQDQAAIDADRAAIGDLTEKSDSFASQLDQDSAAAQAERKENLPQQP